MLTPAQRATVRTAIIADSTANGYRTSGNVPALLDWLNGASGTLGWSVAVPADTSDEAPDYSTFDSIAAGKRDSWGFFLRASRNFARNKVRKWVTDVWGNATASSNAELILQAGTEASTNAQLALGGTSRTTGTVTALDRAFVGRCDEADAQWFVAPENQ